MDRIRVLRLVEYEGPREWVESTLARAIHGTRTMSVGAVGPGRITAVTITQFPEILEQARQTPAESEIV